ncbi:MAG: phosphate ABC transporter substrate-binding protein PstS family protein [Chloroflexota bacterium]
MTKSRVIAAIAALGIVASVLSAPGIAGAAKGHALSGTLTISGSTALLPLVNQAAQDFMAKNSGVTIQVAGGGSGTGLNQAETGAVDIGNSDVSADPAKQPDLVDHEVAVVAFVVVVNKSAGITNLTQQQLYNIYAAPYTSRSRVENWSQVGGANLRTVVVVRPTSSGTRKTFDKIVLKGAYEKGTQALQKDSTNLVLQTVSQTRGAIGYAALGNAESEAARGKVTILSYNGIAPTRANIVTAKYPVIAYEHMYTKGKASPLAQAFIDYISGKDNTSVVQKLGFISMSQMKARIPR